ncbi:hypothetical protein F503_03075 [Ophiostoma piceae UAMH 11346]|uniref:Uncharacterized protein n=1 Tax=Ophiostoma piceae (strain UAMH 11346) TaxID=1262450 RepID=S3CJM8_OPHP1|nr:hypothetical protein F503_03075 [Ophiostoma piceae UAMH 11346]
MYHSSEALLFCLRHASHKASGEDMLSHLAGYLEQADVKILYNTSTKLRRYLPDSATSQWQNPLERLKYVTALARSMPNHYACDSCFQLHPVTPSASLRSSTSPPPYDGSLPRYSSRTSYLFKKAKQFLRRKTKKPTARAQAVGEAQNTVLVEQTHNVTVYAAQRALQGDPSGLSAVRPPCKAHLKLMKSARPPGHALALVTLFENLIHDANDGRRTPLAGLTHQHVQMALKRWRIQSESDPYYWPERALPTYSAVRRVLGYKRGTTVEIKYRFTPRIVTRHGRNYYMMRTVVYAPSFVPISLCPHQIINQYDLEMQYLSKFKGKQAYNGNNIVNPWYSFQWMDPSPGPIFNYSLKEDAALREPAIVDIIMYKGLRLYNKWAGRTRGRPPALGLLPHPFKTFRPAVSLYTSCKHCPTDIEVTCSDTVKYTVWQNFGSEGSALDPVWQSQIPGSFLQAQYGLDDAQTRSCMSPHEQNLPWETNSYRSGPSVWVERGSVWYMYRKYYFDT